MVAVVTVFLMEMWMLSSKRCKGEGYGRLELDWPAISEGLVSRMQIQSGGWDCLEGLAL